MRDNTLIVFSSDNGGTTNAVVATARARRAAARGDGVSRTRCRLERRAPRRQGQPATKAACACRRSSTGRRSSSPPSSTSRCTWSTSCRRCSRWPAPRRARRQAARRQGHLGDPRRGQAVAARRHPDQRRAFRGAIRKGKWKLVKIALLPGKTELFDLAQRSRREDRRRGSTTRRSSATWRRRLIAYAKRAEAERVAEGAAGLPRARRARPCSIRTSTSTTAACRTRSRPCRRNSSGVERMIHRVAGINCFELSTSTT